MNRTNKEIFRFYVSAEEIKNPNLIIRDFFTDGLLSEHLEILKSWKKSVCLASYYKKDNFPGILVWEYKLIIKLLSAAWLLRKNKEAAELLKETLDLHEFFKTFNLKNYHRILNHCLMAGLSMYRIDDTLKIHEFVMIYKNLKKLFKAFYIFSELEKSIVF